MFESIANLSLSSARQVRAVPSPPIPRLFGPYTCTSSLSLSILVQAAVEAVSKPNKQNENSTPSSSTGDEAVGKEQASEQGKGKKKGKTVGASDEADTGPVLHPKPTVRVMFNDLG